MTRHLRVALLAGLAASGFCATAQAQSGLYFGGSVGNAQVGYDSPSEGDIQDFELDESDIGYKLYGGFKFTIAAVEAGYVNFGTIENDAANVEITGFDAFGILSLGLGPVDLFGKLGGFVWESDIQALESTYSEDGFDPAMGFGVSFNLGGLGVRGEYEYFDISEFDKVTMLSVGATYWF